jgi:hypothetical protein
MPLLPVTNIDFDGLSDNIVTQFFKTGEPLEKLSASVAIKESLNPEEVKRLVEKSNTGAIISMLKTSSDKKVEFDLADPDKVLEMTHGKGRYVNGTEKTASVYDETQTTGRPFVIPNTRSTTYDLKSFLDSRLFEKTSTVDPVKENTARLKEYYQMQKEKNDLVYTKTNLEKEAQDSINYILSELSEQSAVPFDKFAQDMLAINDDKKKNVRKILTKFAEAIGVTVDINKIKTNARVVDDTTKLASEFNTVLCNSDKLVKIGQQLAVLEKRLSTFFSDTYKG